MRNLLRQSITIIEATGEDAQGHTTTRTTTQAGSYAEITEGQRLAAEGPVPAGAAFVAFMPDGYGTSWSIKPGDVVSCGTHSGVVLSASEIRNPRTDTLHHIEATVG